MNILYILGNGFDLSLGLETSYKSFLEYYCYPLKPTKDSQYVQNFKNHVWKDLDTWADLESILGQWMDGTINEKEAVEVHDNLIKEMSVYMKREQERLSFDEKINESLVNSLINISQSISYDKDRDALQLYINGRRRKTNSIKTITLNYTDTFERLVFPSGEQTIERKFDDLQYVIERPIHIHGTVDKGMILGVNDKSQIKDNKIADKEAIRNRYIKPIVINEVSRNNVEFEVDKAIRSADIICIYGASYGKTDKRIWEKVIAGTISLGKKLILFHYGNTDFTGQEETQKRDFMNKQTRLFLSHKYGFNEDKLINIPKNILSEYNSKIFVLRPQIADRMDLQSMIKKSTQKKAFNAMFNDLDL